MQGFPERKRRSLVNVGEEKETAGYSIATDPARQQTAAGARITGGGRGKSSGGGTRTGREVRWEESAAPSSPQAPRPRALTRRELRRRLNLLLPELADAAPARKTGRAERESKAAYQLPWLRRRGAPPFSSHSILRSLSLAKRGRGLAPPPKWRGGRTWSSARAALACLLAAALRAELSQLPQRNPREASRTRRSLPAVALFRLRREGAPAEQ